MANIAQPRDYRKLKAILAWIHRNDPTQGKRIVNMVISIAATVINPLR